MNIEKVLLVGIQESYNYLKANELLEEDKLYFCTDTKNLYRGKYLYTDAVRRVINRPTDLKDIAVGKIYYICSTNTLEYYDEGLKKWIVLRPRIVGGIEVKERERDRLNAAGEIVCDEITKEPIKEKEEYISEEYIDTIPTSLAVYNLIKTQIDKNNNSGNVVTGLSEKGKGELTVHYGNDKEAQVLLRNLLMRPTKAKSVNGRIVAMDEKGLPITREADANIYEKDENGNIIGVLKTNPPTIEYQIKDSFDENGNPVYEAGNLVDQWVYPVTGSDYPLMTPDVHVDPGNPKNGFNSKKGRYEIYLTDGTKVILPIGGTVGEVGTGDDVGGFESSQLPNYTKYINVKGGETPTAKNESKKNDESITISTNVKLSNHPNNSLYIDGYSPDDDREADYDDDSGNDPYEGKLVWVAKDGYINWVDVTQGKRYYLQGGGIYSEDYTTNHKWHDLDDVAYSVISDYNRLCVRWIDDVYITDPSGSIIGTADSEDEDADIGDDFDETDDTDDDTDNEEIEDDEEIGDENSSEDEDGAVSDKDEIEKEPPKGNPVSVTHWYRIGVYNRPGNDSGSIVNANAPCHCFKPANMPSETDGSGRSLLYYFTFDNITFYKFFSKEVRTPQPPDSNGNPVPEVITYDTQKYEITEQVNSQVYKHFSLDRFDYADLNQYDDPIQYDGTGLMVDLTPYTKLTLFWDQINTLKADIEALNVKFTNEINRLHELLRIDEF